MISDRLMHLLIETEAFKDFKHLYVYKKEAVKDMKPLVFKHISKAIKEAVDRAVAMDKTDKLKNELANRVVLNFETVQSILDPDSDVDEYETRRRKTRHAFMIYAGIDKWDWPEFEYVPVGAEDPVKKWGLTGYWYVYRFGNADKSKRLQRTVLQVAKNHNGPVILHFKSLFNEFTYGRLVLSGKLLTFRFEKDASLQGEAKTLEITARIPEQLTEQPTVLNGLLRSTLEGNPFVKSCVLVYAGKPENVINIEEVMDLATDGTGADTVVGDNSMQVKNILAYLGREADSLEARPFSPPNNKGIEISNAHIYRTGFHEQFSENYSGTWHSVCLHPDKPGLVSIKQWVFSFDATGSKLVATCDKDKGEKFSLIGDVHFSSERLLLQMKDVNSNKQVVNIAAAVPRVYQGKLYAITTKVHESTSFREIFVRASDQMKLEVGNMEIDAFIDFPGLANFEKQALLDKKAAFLQWPDFSEQHKKDVGKLLDYCGRYLAFIPNVYEDGKRALFQITLNVDKAGGVIEETLAADKVTPVIYHGTASLLTNTLRLTNESDDMRRSEYLFRINPQDSSRMPYLSGITLDTDFKGYPCADACIAIREENLRFPEKELPFPFVPRILMEGSDEYKELDSLILQYTSRTIDDFYYQTYRSIRYKKNV